jgi:hypothetical protein
MLAGTTNASALPVSVGDALYLGYVDPVDPSTADAEVFYINYLANLEVGEVETGVDPPGDPDIDYTFSRANSTLTSATPFPMAILAGHLEGTSGGPDDVSGFFFLIARYGTVGHVWVINGLSGSIELPPSVDGNALEHWTLYRAGVSGSVPDGGATLGLLGLAMLGLGLLRQRLT